MKRICVFDDVKIRIWQWKNTGTMNRPLRLAECSLGVFVVFVGCFRGCSLGILWLNVDILRNVRNLLIVCMLHIRKTKVWFLPCKSMVFGVQKGGFYNAKSGFLKEHIGILGV